LTTLLFWRCFVTDQPSDGATGGGSSGRGHSNKGSSDSGGSKSSQGAAKAPPPGGSGCSGGSSSGGDNGDDDPRKYYGSEDHKSVSDVECEEEENDEEKSGDLATGYRTLKYTPENMVTYKLQPMRLTNNDQTRRINGPTLSDSRQVCHQPSASSPHLAMFNFEQSREQKFCRMENEPSVDQPATPEYHHEGISAASMEEEEYITLSASSEAISPGGIPMDTVCM